MRADLVVTASMLAAALGASSAPAPSWQKRLSSGKLGSFPPPRAMELRYQFGWGGVTAAKMEASVRPKNPRILEFAVVTKTVGVTRTLWRMDGTYRSVIDSRSLRAIEAFESEQYRAKKLETTLRFTPEYVSRLRESTPPGSSPPKWRDFKWPGTFEVFSALLHVRSQPLKSGDSETIVVYPMTGGYLATTTVLGRESIKVDAGRFDAIKLDLQLSRIGKDFKLEPHKKFKTATIWVSDDRDRLLLRVEGELFIGKVFAELESVKFSDR